MLWSISVNEFSVSSHAVSPNFKSEISDVNHKIILPVSLIYLPKRCTWVFFALLFKNDSPSSITIKSGFTLKAVARFSNSFSPPLRVTGCLVPSSMKFNSSFIPSTKDVILLGSENIHSAEKAISPSRVELTI